MLATTTKVQPFTLAAREHLGAFVGLKAGWPPGTTPSEQELEEELLQRDMQTQPCRVCGTVGQYQVRSFYGNGEWQPYQVCRKCADSRAL